MSAMENCVKILLELASAQGHWARDENDNNWIVQDNNGKKLWEFPPGMDEHKCMSAIRLGRKYELEAFNIGIDFGKKEAARMTNIRIKQLEGDIRSLAIMNETLSEQLDQQITGA